VPTSTGMYDLIAANKRKSVLLVIVMTLLVAFTTAVFGLYFGGAQGGVQYVVFFAIIGLVFAGAGALASYYMGTAAIMAVSSAHRADPEQDRQLHNTLEEVCIAAGLPKPDLYVIEDSAPNAFACGRDPEHSAIAVTRGLMNKLTRNELQGVMAHELSHIQNYDIRFATLMTVLVGALVMMCDLFWRMSLFGGRRRRSSSSGKGGSQVEMIIGLVAVLLMILAPLFAQIIKLAASRQREYLADASGAKMTRNPESLARALEKISFDPEPLEAANRGTQHLYIVNPLKGAQESQNWFSTHPPTRARIQRLREMT
jgi:heat shock protein HtpX